MVYSSRLEAMDVFDYFHAKAKLFLLFKLICCMPFSFYVLFG